jgi:hypothetical protein
MGSVLQLFAQLNTIAPNRNKDSDGTFPSPEHHLQNPDSDHEPHLVPGVGSDICTAGDYTHDPANGADMSIMTEELRESHDPRIKYVIFRNRMFSSYSAHGIPAWTWRDYSGKYHGGHAHLSTLDAPIADTWTPWRITMAGLNFNEKAELDALVNLSPIMKLDTGAVVDGKGELKEFPVKMTQAVLGLIATTDALTTSFAMLSGKLDQVFTLLRAMPDPEGPSVETVKAGIQQWMLAAVEKNTEPDDANP